MLSEHPLSDAFEDIDTSDLCFSPHNSQWFPDLFDDIHDGQLSQDDLLTDAVSEIMKFKADIPDLQLEGETHGTCDSTISSGMVLGELLNDVPQLSEDLSVHSFGSNRVSEESSGYVSCVMSSGTPSPTNSPQPKVESPGSHIHDVGQNVEIDQLPTTKEEYDELKSTISASQPSEVAAQRSLFRSQLPTTVNTSNGRVHFIVRPNTSVSLANKTKLTIENPLYCNIRRLTPVANVRHQNDSTEVKAYNQHKPGNFLHIMKTSGVRKLPVSPGNTTSTSSSDSDARDGGDDVCMTPYSQIHVKAANQLSSDSTGGRSSRFKSPIEFTHPYSQFHRSNSPASRVHSRTRSPMQVDRPDVSPSGVLILTDEEKRTLITEGYSIPTRLPLSKQDERNLKKVRRKIKNKISAQESRRKKKEYLEALERKINIYSQENMELKRRVENLEGTNRSLLGQLRLLQQLINKSKTNSSSGINNNSSAVASFSHHSDLQKSGYKNSNSASGNSNHSSGVGGGGGGSASTCLMVFALFFAALLVGKPPASTNQSSLDSGLIFAPPSQGLFDNFISQGPSGFVSGSLSQIGYTWSRRPVYGPYYGNRIRPPNAGANSSAQSPPPASLFTASAIASEVPDCTDQTDWHCSSLVEPHQKVHSPRNAASVSTPRSLLLGAPGELDECSAPPRTLWSFLFGSAGKIKPVELKNTGHMCSLSNPHCLWADDNHVTTEMDLATDLLSVEAVQETVDAHINKTTTVQTTELKRSSTVASIPVLTDVGVKYTTTVRTQG